MEKDFRVVEFHENVSREEFVRRKIIFSERNAPFTKKVCTGKTFKKVYHVEIPRNPFSEPYPFISFLEVEVHHMADRKISDRDMETLVASCNRIKVVDNTDTFDGSGNEFSFRANDWQGGEVNFNGSMTPGDIYDRERGW
jgi:hypothetical protein